MKIELTSDINIKLDITFGFNSEQKKECMIKVQYPSIYFEPIQEIVDFCRDLNILQSIDDESIIISGMDIALLLSIANIIIEDLCNYFYSVTENELKPSVDSYFI